jgi:hypothetical protein
MKSRDHLADDNATARGWSVICMKNDWKRLFPFEA